MKLAKKMLACVIALALVAALAVTSFAASSFSAVATPNPAIVGENVEVVISVSEIKGLEAAGLEISYDTTALEVVSVAEEGCFDGSLYAAGNPEAGLVTAGAAYATAAKADSDKVAIITFKALKTGATKIGVKVTEWVGCAQPADFTFDLTVAEKPSETEPPVVVVTTTETASVTAAPTTKGNTIKQTGDAGIAAVAGVMAIAAVAFVATRKKDEQ